MWGWLFENVDTDKMAMACWSVRDKDLTEDGNNLRMMTRKEIMHHDSSTAYIKNILFDNESDMILFKLIFSDEVTILW